MTRNAYQVRDVATVLGQHRHPGEMLTVLGDAWMVCGCGQKIDLPVRDGQLDVFHAAKLFEIHQARALGAAGLVVGWEPPTDPAAVGDPT